MSPNVQQEAGPAPTEAITPSLSVLGCNACANWTMALPASQALERPSSRLTKLLLGAAALEAGSGADEVPLLESGRGAEAMTPLSLQSDVRPALDKAMDRLSEDCGRAGGAEADDAGSC